MYNPTEELVDIVHELLVRIEKELVEDKPQEALAKLRKMKETFKPIEMKSQEELEEFFRK